MIEVDSSEFFAGLADAPYVKHLDEEQHRALRAMRSALARARPRHVAPRHARGSIGDYMDLHLEIRHVSDPAAWIDVSFGDGYLGLSWPGGHEHGGWKWRPELGPLVEALLAGRNLQTIHRRAGRVVAVETETWDERGVRTQSRYRRRLLAMLLRAHPLRARRRSLSFDRAPGLRHEP